MNDVYYYIAPIVFKWSFRSSFSGLFVKFVKSSIFFIFVPFWFEYNLEFKNIFQVHKAYTQNGLDILKMFQKQDI